MVNKEPERSWHERRLGRTLLRAYHVKLDIDDVLPNDKQPRMGPKEDVELQRQIEANGGLFEPILVEPHPEFEKKYRIVDGDRRWTNSKVLVETHQKDQFRSLPAEVTDRTLTDDERLRVWIYIHRQRKEWDAKEKEMVAYSLVQIVGRASAANILGVTVRALDKLVDVFEVTRQLKGLSDPSSAITWAREIKSLSKKLVTPPVLKEVVKRINKGEVTNSKDVRKLRKILKDPVAKDAFLEKRETIDEALKRVDPPKPTRQNGLAGDLDAITDSIKQYSWTYLESLAGDTKLISKIEEAEKLLKQLKKNIKE